MRTLIELDPKMLPDSPSLCGGIIFILFYSPTYLEHFIVNSNIVEIVNFNFHYAFPKQRNSVS